MLVKPWARVSWISPASRSRSAAAPATCDSSATWAWLASSSAISPARRSLSSASLLMKMPTRIPNTDMNTTWGGNSSPTRPLPRTSAPVSGTSTVSVTTRRSPDPAGAARTAGSRR
jgi:hypothetical protein